MADPFRSRSGPSTSHTHHLESVQMAQTALDLGFAVDVIRFANRTFTPRDPYDLLVEPRYNMERLAAAGVMLRPYC